MPLRMQDANRTISLLLARDHDKDPEQPLATILRRSARELALQVIERAEACDMRAQKRKLSRL